jgi:hypothetical protein
MKHRTGHLFKRGDNFYVRWDDWKQGPHSRREPTVDELQNVCQSALGELRTLLALGVYSGLRLGVVQSIAQYGRRI